MSSGSASHKSTSVKPNVNRNSMIDSGSGDTPTEVDYARNDQDVTPVNPAATERPTDQPSEQNDQ